MFLFYGEENFYAKKRLKKVIQKVNTKNVITFEDFSNVSSITMEILAAIETIDLFSEKKVIVLKNFFKLLQTHYAKFLDLILNSLKNKNNETEVVFILESISIIQNRKFLNFAKQFASIEEGKRANTKDLPNIIQKIVGIEGGTITNDSIFKIINRLPNNLNIIEAEILKVMNFKKDITREMIDKIITEYNSDNVFEFVNAFQNSKLSVLIKIFQEKMSEDISVFSLIGEINRILSLAIQVYSLIILKNNKEQIAQKLNIHPFRIIKTIDLITNIGIKKINSLIIKLAKLEHKAKTRGIDEKRAFQVFLISATN